jgi:thiol-disulfide isomerase/thioredoxin
MTGTGRTAVFLIALFLALAGGAEARERDPAGNPLAGADAWSIVGGPLPDLEGRERNLSDWRGKVIILNFWAPWCPPCRAEVRQLIGYQARFGGQNLQVIGVGLDDGEKLAEFVAREGVNYPVLVAGRDDPLLSPAWGNPKRRIPYTVVIAPDGRVFHSEYGGFDDLSFGVVVEPLLSGP